jgi:flagellar motor switch protein FliM
MARALTQIHETFARYFAGALDAQLGTAVKVKLLTLDQLPVKDHIAGIPAHTFIAPFTSSQITGTVIVECGIELIYPIIDLLLGGPGTPAKEAGELSEIEEEIIQDLTALIARQTENAWRMSSNSLLANPAVKPSGLHQHYPSNEKVTVARFEMEIAGLTGWFQLVFPSSFINSQIKQVGVEQPQKKGQIRYFPTSNIRERILDCDVVVAADLPSIRVHVKDLIRLEPGCVLKLRTPVKTPGMLTVGGREIFELLPVRNGRQKAAQLGRRVQLTCWGKE